ncbi:MAG: hypothetical protein AAGL49_03695 [Pseudomonadota bacterium]
MTEFGSIALRLVAATQLVLLVLLGACVAEDEPEEFSFEWYYERSYWVPGINEEGLPDRVRDQKMAETQFPTEASLLSAVTQDLLARFPVGSSPDQLANALEQIGATCTRRNLDELPHYHKRAEIIQFALCTYGQPIPMPYNRRNFRPSAELMARYGADSVEEFLRIQSEIRLSLDWRVVIKVAPISTNELQEITVTNSVRTPS